MAPGATTTAVHGKPLISALVGGFGNYIPVSIKYITTTIKFLRDHYGFDRDVMYARVTPLPPQPAALAQTASPTTVSQNAEEVTTTLAGKAEQALAGVEIVAKGFTGTLTALAVLTMTPPTRPIYAQARETLANQNKIGAT